MARAFTHAAHPQTWEVSHIGGDRFAPNVLVLPHGLYYGRLAPADVERFVADHLAGRLDVEHLRGRSAYAFPVQAAEIYLRRHLDLHEVAPLPLVSHEKSGRETSVVYEVDGKAWRVRVHTEPGERGQLTCRATAPSSCPAHRLVGIEPATG